MILAKNIKKYYKDTCVLDIENLEIKQGEFVAITGESGSGKTTLLNMLSSLDNPASGDVFIDNINTKKLNDKNLSKLRNEKIGFIFQSFYLQPFLNVVSNIELSSAPNKMNKKERRQKAEKLLKIVGLQDKKSAMPNELSGGQIQRVAIARALLNSPDIIFADEPTGNLDSDNTEHIMRILQAINKSTKATVIIVTHDNSLASRADRIIKLKDGRIESDVKI